MPKGLGNRAQIHLLIIVRIITAGGELREEQALINNKAESNYIC